LREATFDDDIALVQAHRHSFLVKYLRTNMFPHHASQFLFGWWAIPQSYPLICQCLHLAGGNGNPPLVIDVVVAGEKSVCSVDACTDK
jgi:hypothetical protein